MVDSEFVKLLFNNRQDTRGDHCWHIYFPLLRKFALFNIYKRYLVKQQLMVPQTMNWSFAIIFYKTLERGDVSNTLDTTVEPSKSEFPPQMSRSRYFSFYFHCIKIPVNRNPSTLDKLSIISKRFQHYVTPLNRTTFVSPKLFWQYMCWHSYTRCFIQIAISRVRVYIMAVRMQLKTAW